MIKPTNLLYITADLDVGGTQRHLIQLASCLRNDYNIQVLTFKDGILRKELDFLNIPVYVLKVGGDLGGKTVGLARLVQFLRRRHFQLVHSLLGTATIYGPIAAAIAKVPVKVCSQRNTGYWLTSRFKKAFSKWVYSHLVDYVCVNAAIIREIIVREWNVPWTKVTFIPNGIDLQKCFMAVSRRDEIRARLGCGSSEVLLGLVATLRPIKGIEYAIMATHLLINSGINVRLAIVGDGPERELLQQIAREKGCADHVLFLGFHPNPLEVIPAFDIAILSSLTEGFPQAVLEYMACGKAVVATAVGDLPQLIQNGETGFLIPPRDAKALAEAIMVLILNKNLRDAIGQRAREKVEREYSLSTMITRYKEIYQRFLNGCILKRGAE